MWALKIYILAIIVWTFGSMAPQWRYQGWYKAVDAVVAPYVGLFRPLNLVYNNFDFSPMAAVLAIYLFQTLLVYALARGGY